MVLAGGLDVAGLGAWTDTGGDFESGEHADTEINDRRVRLELNESHTGNWSQMDEGSPCAYNGDCGTPKEMVYDSSRGVFVFFDAWNVWTFNVTGKAWTKHNLSAYIDCYFVMAYDLVYNKTVMYTGKTWTYDISTNLWTDMKPSISPPGLSTWSSSMAYDLENQRMVLFNPGFFNEVWAYDQKGNLWTKMGSSPVLYHRGGYRIVYDRTVGEFILFGGSIYKYHWERTILNDTWTYDLATNTWTERHPAASPPPLSHYSLVYDDHLGVSVLFGGVTSEGDRSHATDEVWWYDASDDIWMNKTPEYRPQPRVCQAAGYDSRSETILLVGGINNSARFGDTWTYDSANNTWTNDICLVLPVARGGAVMARGKDQDGIAMFGGDVSCPWDYAWWFETFPDDLLTFNVTMGIWTVYDMNPAPAGRSGHAMVYDSRDRVLVLFGGKGGDNELMNDTWCYDFSTGMWENMTPPDSPCKRRSLSMGYDPDRGVVVLFGGNDSRADLGDTWQYNYSTNEWTNLTPLESPPADSASAMAYDEANHVITLGSSSDHTFWYYDALQNTWVQKGKTFPNIGITSMTYNSRNGTLIIGYRNGIYFYNASSDGWAYGGWPSHAELGYALAYDRASDSIVLFGGYSTQGSMNHYSDTVFVSDFKRYPPSGTFTSRPFDTGGFPIYGTIGWTATVPAASGLRFQLRTAMTCESLPDRPFIGPDGSAGTFYTAPNQAIPVILDGGRWVQYRAFLNTSDLNLTPVLDRVTIRYNLRQSVEVASPSEGDTWSRTHDILWSATDPDNDTLLFDIYLESGASSVRLASNLTDGTRRWAWNASSAAPGAYRVRVVARDDNPSIPVKVAALSGNFTVPGPNRPPHVELVWPPDNAVVNDTSLRLLWTGSDPDGDPLSYTVRYSSRPPSGASS